MKFKPGDLIRNSDTRDLCLILEIKDNTQDSKFLILLIKGFCEVGCKCLNQE